MRILAGTIPALVAVAVVATMAVAPAGADIIGTSVFGELNFDGYTDNFFDPVNGFVPPGSPNSSGSTAAITGRGLGLAFEDGCSTLEVSFTSDTFTLSYLPIPDGPRFKKLRRRDPHRSNARTFDGLMMNSNIFNGTSFHLPGDAFQFNFGQEHLRNRGDSATFQLAGSASPRSRDSGPAIRMLPAVDVDGPAALRRAEAAECLNRADVVNGRPAKGEASRFLFFKSPIVISLRSSMQFGWRETDVSLIYWDYSGTLHCKPT